MLQELRHRKASYIEVCFFIRTPPPPVTHSLTSTAKVYQPSFIFFYGFQKFCDTSAIIKYSAATRRMSQIFRTHLLTDISSAQL